MEFTGVMERVAKGFEIVGVAIILIGGAHGFVRAASARFEGRSVFMEARTRFGQPLLLGLEVLVAADIIETVTVDRTLETVASLRPPRAGSRDPQLLARHRDRRPPAVAAPRGGGAVAQNRTP